MTLLRLRPLTTSNAPSNPTSVALPPVPYPGGPLDSDAQIVARPQGSLPETALLSLKGELASMGVLDTDEGLRSGDLEALSALWTKLRSLGERAQKNG